MNKDVNKFLNEMVKYDLYVGIIISLILSVTITTKFSIIYFIGTIVSMVNFFVSGKITKKRLEKKRGGVLFSISYFIRHIVVVIVAVPFIFELRNLMAYIVGFLSHFVVLTIYCIKSQKGSD
ncbi:MAG: ATP synthase subunit I [Clostridium sp.]